MSAVFVFAIVVSQFAGLGAGLAHAAGAVTWTGTAGDNKFSTAGNWSGGVAPVNGDSLNFGVLGSSTSQVTLNNDLSGVSFSGVSYGDSTKGTAVATTYVINNLHLADNATITQISAQGEEYSNVAITLSDGGTFSVGSHLTLSGKYPELYTESADLDINVTNLTITGTGLTALSQAGGGSGASAPRVVLHPTNLTITSGSQYTASYNSITSVTVQNGGRVFIGSASPANITYNIGTSDAAFPALVAYDTVNLTGTVNLAGDSRYYIYGTSTLTISGVLSGTGSLTAGTGSTGTFVNNASSNTTSTAGGSQEVPVTNLPAITDDQSSVSLHVLPKTAVSLDGARGYVYVGAGGILNGTGTADSLYVSVAGVVAPGHSPGKLTVLTNLSIYGNYQAELQNATAGGYDQIQVSDPSRTTGQDVNIDSAAVLDVSLYAGYHINKGDAFTIINNLQPASQKVNGTFAGLPEGAQFSIGGIVFSVTYVGGDGNDVVLTALNTGSDPNAPNTAVLAVRDIALKNPLVVALAGISAVLAIGILAKRSIKNKR